MGHSIVAGVRSAAGRRFRRAAVVLPMFLSAESAKEDDDDRRDGQRYAKTEQPFALRPISQGAICLTSGLACHELTDQIPPFGTRAANAARCGL